MHTSATPWHTASGCFGLIIVTKGSRVILQLHKATNGEAIQQRDFMYSMMCMDRFQQLPDSYGFLTPQLPPTHRSFNSRLLHQFLALLCSLQQVKITVAPIPQLLGGMMLKINKVSWQVYCGGRGMKNAR